MLNPVEPRVPTYQASIVPTEPYSWPHCGEVLRKTFLCILWLRGDSFGLVSLPNCFFHSIAQTFFPVWGSHWLFLSILSVSIDACVHMYMYLHMCVCTCVHIPTEDRGPSWVSLLRHFPLFLLLRQVHSLTCGLPTTLDWLAGELQSATCLYHSSSGVTSTGRHHQPYLPLLSYHSPWLEMFILPKNCLLSSTVFLSSGEHAYAKA